MKMSPDTPGMRWIARFNGLSVVCRLHIAEIVTLYYPRHTRFGHRLYSNAGISRETVAADIRREFNLSAETKIHFKWK